MLEFAVIRPAPPLPPPGSSLAGWLWLCLALAAVLAVGVIIASRR
jgi:hypothetical protein